MSHLVSLLLDNVSLFDPDLPGLPVHGANLSTVELLRRFAVHDGVDALEVFLPPSVMVRTDLLAQVAASALPPNLRGRGRLRFYPVHSIPAVWSDAKPRVLFSIDPEWLPRERYLRDRFAVGPMPLTSDTHALGHHQLWRSLTRYAAATPVEFDSIVSLSVSSQGGLRNAFDGWLDPDVRQAPCRIDRISRGVDTDLFHPRDIDAKVYARRLLRLPLDVTITLYLGRVTPHGKADLLPLIRAFAESTNAVNDVLVIAGDEYPEGYGRKLVELGTRLGLADRLIVTGKVEPSMRPLYYGAADIFVFPGDTVQEMFPNTILEAMASGLPCIVSDWDGARDPVVDGVTGYTIPTRWMPGANLTDRLSPATSLSVEFLLAAQRVWVDTRKLADHLVTLLVSPENRKTFGDAGRQRAVDEFSWPSIIDRWIALWDELAGIAAAETDDERHLRRAGAMHLGLPTDYDRLFAHYATSTVDTSRDSIRLSASGLAVANGSESLQFYDEVLPTVKSPIVDALFAALMSAGSEWTVVDRIVDDVVRSAKCSEADALFHVSLLLKRDLLELSVE
jgi:glycosyltransferase involved in cell wall biosynthesis